MYEIRALGQIKKIPQSGICPALCAFQQCASPFFWGRPHAWFMMHDAWCTMHNTWWMLSRLCLKSCLFCTYAHAWCHTHFFHHVKFYFRYRQLISFPVSGQLCCDSQDKESPTVFSGNMKCPLHCYISPFWGSSSFFRLSAFFRLSSFFWSSSFFR